MALTGHDKRGYEDFTARVAAYGDVVAAMRVCQLYIFMNVLFVIQAPLNYAMTLAAYGAAQLGAQFVPLETKPPPLSLLWGGRPPYEIIVLALVVYIFSVYARMRTVRWTAGLCLLALGYNTVQFLGWMVLNDQAFVLPESPLNPHPVALFGGMIFVIGFLGVHVWFFVIAVRGQAAIRHLSVADRHWMREVGDRWPAILRSALMVPEAIRYARRRVLAGGLMIVAGVANFMNYWRLSYLHLGLTALPPVLWLMRDDFRDVFIIMGQPGDFSKGLGFLAVLLALLGILFGFFIGVYLMIRFFSRWALRRARAFMSRSLEDVKAMDERRPILFLRSFLDDQVALQGQRNGWALWMLDDASQTETLDNIVLTEGTPNGPTVALGAPDDTAPPYGAARGYFAHDDWRGAVSALAQDAQAIIFALDDTPGVAWEIEHIATAALADKTLFLIPPERVGPEGAALLAHAIRMIGEEPPTNLDAAFGYHRTTGAMFAANTNAYAYRLATRRFLGGTHALAGHPAA